MTALLAFLVAFVGLLAVVVGLTCLRAFVLLKLWTWFVMPLFGLPALTIPYAIGLSLVVSLFFHSTAKKEDKNFWVSAITSPLIALFIGWIVQMFIG